MYTYFYFLYIPICTCNYVHVRKKIEKNCIIQLSSKYAPIFWKQRAARFATLNCALLITLKDRLFTSVSIFCLRLFKLRGLGLYTLDFKKPHAKKSRGFRSGEYGDHSRPRRFPLSLLRARTFPSNCVSSVAMN